MFDDDAPVTSGPSSPMLDGAQCRPAMLDGDTRDSLLDGAQSEDAVRDIRDSPSRLMHGGVNFCRVFNMGTPPLNSDEEASPAPHRWSRSRSCR